MDYSELFYIIPLSWIIAVAFGILFNYKTHADYPEYVETLSSHTNRILFMSGGGIVALLIGNASGNVIKYIIFGIYAIFLIVELIPYLISIVLAVMLFFIRPNRFGPNDLPKGLAWLFILVRSIANATIVYIALKMFTSFFLMG